MTHLMATVVVACIVLWSQAAGLIAAQTQQAQPPKAVFRFEVSGPEQTPSLQVTMREGEEGIVEIKDVGRFGLAPRSGKDDRFVLVTISDLSNGPARVVGEVAVPTDKKIVTSGTKPPFGIRLRGLKR